MYLIINGNRHTCSKRIHSKDTIKYLSVTPAPENIGGTVQMYRDDGFLMCEDNIDGFERKTYVGTLLTVTNKPVLFEDPTRKPEYRLSVLEEENNLLKAQVAAQTDQMDFYEECIAEMAMVVYA